ncbi:hypothetical protein ACFWEJ_27065 [Promicromonospora sp. NPDC060204]|uniref:hypothetical protein n=1 Tax=Promicromonospora sp. NPDC060204 TaxID=3347071 RepID=UPI003648F942
MERSMSTSVTRRFLPSARRTCASLLASGLVLGLGVTAAGASPAIDTLAASTTEVVAPTLATDAELLDPSFVPEGMPSTHGGQVVAWGSLSGAFNGNSPRALPDGVHAVALSSDDRQILILRGDGGVDIHGSGAFSGSSRHLTPPDGTTFTAVSAGWDWTTQILRSDGIVVNASGTPVKTPPQGLRYTAISGHLALRSDGTLDPASAPGESCSEARDPGADLTYTAITARRDSGDWAALRSDGVILSCHELVDGWETRVVNPPAGTRFIGVDMGNGEVVGATVDGRVLSSSGTQLAAAPAGRSVVSLAAMNPGQGSAALDDGSILSWGLSGRNATPPLVPAERAVFSAVDGHGGSAQHWAIMVGDPVPVEVSLQPVLPSGRPLRVTDDVRIGVNATLADGVPVSGQFEPTSQAPDGQVQVLETVGLWPSDPAEIRFSTGQHELTGTHLLDVTFSGSPYAATTVETSFDFQKPANVKLTTSGPATWHDGTEKTLCFTLATEDGSPLWWPTTYGPATISVGSNAGDVYEAEPPPWDGAPGNWCMHYLQLEPGTYTAQFDYQGWGEADSVSWTGQVVVLPPAATRVESDLPSSWRYGQMPDFVAFDVLSDSLVPVGVAVLQLDDGTWFGAGDQLDENGRGKISIGHEDELAPGTYPMTVLYRGGYGFAPARLERTVTVEPGVFTAATPRVTGTAKVGSKLTAATGIWSPTPTSFRYAWKVDGVAVAGATSSTFTVPASAAGKKVTVTVTGLKQYYESSATSAPTSAVAPGTFTAPKPTIKGTAKVGATLTATRGTWSPTPSSVKYVWKANGTTISTRTSSTFVVPASAKGKRLTVTVIGTRTGYTTRSVASSATSTVAAGTFTAPRPTITGTKRVGSTLTVSRGTWSPAPSSVKYVWKADGVTISTRTSNRFVIPARARGKHLTVTVTGSRAGYTTRSVTSTGTVTIR